MIKSICVIGVGGVGGYFGGKMAANNTGEFELTFVARGEHLAAIQKSGLQLFADGQEYTAVPDHAVEISELEGKYDLVILCTKSYDLEGVLGSIAGNIGPDTLILPLLNGIDIPERIRSVTDKGIVFPACVYVGTHIAEPGVVRQAGGDGRILFGAESGFEDMATELSEVLARLGINQKYSSDVQMDIWNKYIFIAAYGIVGAATGLSIGEIYASSVHLSDVRGIMEEIRQVAVVRGVALSEIDIEKALVKATNFPAGTKTSFQRDYENPQKKNESDLFSKTIVLMAQEYGVSAPVVNMYHKKYFG